MSDVDPLRRVPPSVFEDSRPQLAPEPREDSGSISIRDICALGELRLKALGRLKHETTVCRVRDESLGLAEVRFTDNPEEEQPSRVYVSSLSTPLPLPQLHLNGLDYTYQRSIGCGITEFGVPDMGIVNIVTESGHGRPFEYTVGEAGIDDPVFEDLDHVTKREFRRLASALLRITPEDIIETDY